MWDAQVMGLTHELVFLLLRGEGVGHWGAVLTLPLAVEGVGHWASVLALPLAVVLPLHRRGFAFALSAVASGSWRWQVHHQQRVVWVVVRVERGGEAVARTVDVVVLAYEATNGRLRLIFTNSLFRVPKTE